MAVINILMKPTLITLSPFPIRTDITSVHDDLPKTAITGYEVDFEFATMRFKFRGSCTFKSKELTPVEIQTKVLEALKDEIGIDIEPLIRE
jgi:hypothetical protein